MWFAVVFFCTVPSDLNSCVLSGNTAVMHTSEEACLEDARAYATTLLMQNIYARPACFKLGEQA